LIRQNVSEHDVEPSNHFYRCDSDVRYGCHDGAGRGSHHLMDGLSYNEFYAY